MHNRELMPTFHIVFVLNSYIVFLVSSISVFWKILIPRVIFFQG